MKMTNQTPPRIHIQKQLKLFRRIVFVILLLGFMMLGVMILGHMDDEVVGSGSVMGIREYELKTLVSAKTTKICRYEGDFVRAGEKLLEFDSRNQRDRIELIRNEIKELEITLRVKQKDLEILRKDPLPSYYRHTEIQLKEAQERFQRSSTEVEVYGKLFEQKAISRREYLKVEMDHLSNRMSLARLREDWKKLQTGLAREIMEKANGELKQLQQQLENKRSELRMAERHLEDYSLFAPDAGIVTDIPPRPGNYYSKGDVMIKFSANQHKKIVALVNENQVYKVEPGQRARIASSQYNYLDYGYFYGKVDFVYQLPVSINGQNFYPVKLILTSEPYPLRFGSSCEITIMTGREKILFVLLGIRSQDYLKRRAEGWKRRANTLKEMTSPVKTEKSL